MLARSDGISPDDVESPVEGSASRAFSAEETPSSRTFALMIADVVIQSLKECITDKQTTRDI